MEPTNMSDKHSDADAFVSGGIHGQHHSVNDEYVPKSVWQSGVVRRLADYIRHVREVDDQSNQRVVSNKPGESTQSQQPGFTRHVCARNPNRTCNCDAGVCADDSATYRYARGPFLSTRILASEQPGNFRCPISGSPCAEYQCREWCAGSSARAETDADRGNASTTINR
jgi:hypothetical protein